MFGLFKSEPVIDDATRQWLFDTFAWAQQNFGAGVFRDETILVTPSNQHFPGRANSAGEMAQLIFDRVRAYAGMTHWPMALVDGRACAMAAAPTIHIEGALRGSKAKAQPASTEGAIPIIYDPQLLNNPEAMIATFAHTLAHYLGQMANEAPPGGAENWPHATEALAVYMGFGLMFANSAFNLKISSCGSCGGPKADRQSYLSQYDSTYALALFSVLKGISNNEVLPHLKSSLRGYYKKCMKDIRQYPDEIQRIKDI